MSARERPAHRAHRLARRATRVLLTQWPGFLGPLFSMLSPDLAIYDGHMARLAAS